MQNMTKNFEKYEVTVLWRLYLSSLLGTALSIKQFHFGMWSLSLEQDI
jgi:hypothetical protein